MTIRMNKALREEIADAVYNASDLPARLSALDEMAHRDVKRIIEESRPPEFVRLIEGAPKEWFLSIGYVYLWGSAEHPETGKSITLSSGEIGVWGGGTSFHLHDPVPIPACGTKHREYVFAWFYDVYRPLYMKWAEDRQTLMNSVHALLASHRTVAALLKDAPELKKFIPTRAASYPLAFPTHNVISTLISRGVKLELEAA